MYTATFSTIATTMPQQVQMQLVSLYLYGPHHTLHYAHMRTNKATAFSI